MTSKQNSSATKDLSEVTQQDVPSCAEKNLSCQGDNSSPTVCTVDTYKGSILPEWEVFKGWGPSACLARSDLFERACNMGADIAEMGTLSCAPDPSFGECREVQDDCEVGDQRVYCFAGIYDGRKLNSTQIIAGRGLGKCKAKSDLVRMACISNLRPTRLGKIACLEDATAEGCPVEAKKCVGDYFPFFCSGLLEGGVLPEQLNAEVFAENSCLAETKLKQLACNLNIAPKKIQGQRCFAAAH